MILQSAGNDFGGRGASAIGEQNERNRRRDGIIGGDEGLILSAAGANARDLLSLLEEEIAHAQRLIEDAAGISAKVDDDALGSLA